MNRRVTRLLLALYPRAWRDRYGAEVASLTDELIRAGETTPLPAGLNLVAGAAVERARALAGSRSALAVTSAAVIVAMVGGAFVVTGGARPGSGPRGLASANCLVEPPLQVVFPAAVRLRPTAGAAQRSRRSGPIGCPAGPPQSGPPAGQPGPVCSIRSALGWSLRRSAPVRSALGRSPQSGLPQPVCLGRSALRLRSAPVGGRRGRAVAVAVCESPAQRAGRAWSLSVRERCWPGPTGSGTSGRPRSAGSCGSRGAVSGRRRRPGPGAGSGSEVACSAARAGGDSCDSVTGRNSGTSAGAKPPRPVRKECEHASSETSTPCIPCIPCISCRAGGHWLRQATVLGLGIGLLAGTGLIATASAASAHPDAAGASSGHRPARAAR